MKTSKYNEEQIAFALRQTESGTSTAVVCRKIGICDATFYLWEKKFAGLGVSELPQLKQLEEENVRLKRMLANVLRKNEVPKETLLKMHGPPRLCKMPCQCQEPFASMYPASR